MGTDRPERSAPGFTEIARDVFVLRHPVLDVNATLIVGDGAALLVDTLSSSEQARQLAGAARRITGHPWTVVNTHHHFDHCLGNAVLAGADRPVWAQEETAALLRERPDWLRRRWYAECLDLDAELAGTLPDAPILAPTRTVRTSATLDVGGRAALLLHPGRGHTAGDLVVFLPDVDVLIAGDLVEQGAPPSFADSYPVDWAQTLARLLELAPDAATVVPGHGAVTGRDFVTAQHAELTELAWLIREGHADGAPVQAVAARAPYAPPTALDAVRRGYAELDGAG